MPEMVPGMVLTGLQNGHMVQVRTIYLHFVMVPGMVRDGSDMVPTGPHGTSAY